MRARGDIRVMHEPFMHRYYAEWGDQVFADFDPKPRQPQSYDDTRAAILAAADVGAVFFKDMAYYTLDRLPADRAFWSAMTHAFLIRDPAEAVVSYQKRDPGFTRTELGLEAQFRLHEALESKALTPLVLTSDRRRGAPEATLARYWRHAGLPFAGHAFAWDDTVPEDWQEVAGWHTEVLGRGKIERPAPESDAAAELAALCSPFTEHERHHRPFYKALREIAERQAKGG